MSPTIALIHSAFGPTTTLYDALGSSKNACQADLRRAYRKLALKYHPDKQARPASNTDGLSIKDSTAKFQAVSAAYEVLMDEKRRSVYDATGRIVEDNEVNFADAGNFDSSSEDECSQRSKQRRWNDFFHSVFNDLMTADSKHGDARSYRSSRQEQDDVLKYYRTCKGDLQMVLKCVVHGIEKDIDRWKKDIIMPAILKGDIEDYCGIMDSKNSDVDSVHSSIQKPRSCDLVDSDEDEDDVHNILKRKIKNKTGHIKLKRVKGSSDKVKYKKPMKSTATTLIDSEDDAEDGCNNHFGEEKALSMSRRDKMEYRVAKKRKLKAKREIEIANIMKSKAWEGGDAWESSLGQRGKRDRSGFLSNAMLSNMEKKYSKSTDRGKGTKLRRKK